MTPPSMPESTPTPRTHPPARPTVAVTVCAYTMDRWDDVLRGMTALSRQSVAPDQIVLVIDHHDLMLARARAQFPEALVIANTGPRGASGARNTAVEHCTTDVVAFLDDDAEPHHRWLELLLEPYAEPSVVAVGGSAQPRWPDDHPERPAHLAPELDWIIGCSHRGQPTERTDVRNLWGCNMSVRREAFRSVGGFDESIGRVGTTPLGAEETLLCIELAMLDPTARIVYEPGARVRHRVGPERTEWSYLCRRSLAEGISKATISRTTGRANATSVERDYVRRILTAGLRRELGRGLRGERAGWRAASGILTSVLLAGWGYFKGSLGRVPALGAGAPPSPPPAVDRRDPDGPDARTELEGTPR